MAGVFERACAVADLWASSVNHALSQELDPETAEWKEKFWDENISKMFLHPKPPTPAKSVQELIAAVDKLSQRYREISSRKLVTRWKNQAIAYRTFHASAKRIQAQNAAQIDGESSAIQSQSDVGALREYCLHYADLLTERCRITSQGNVMTRSLIKLVNRRDTNREIDLEISAHLSRLAEYLALQEPPVVSAPEPQPALLVSPVEWLLSSDLSFGSSAYWPVPVMFEYTGRVEKRAGANGAPSQETDHQSADFPLLFQDLVLDALQNFELTEAEAVRYWCDLLRPYLEHHVLEPGPELARLVSEFFAGKRKWFVNSNSWDSEALLATANLLYPPVELIPLIREDATLDWDSLQESELQVVEAVSPQLKETAIHFGIRGETPVRVEVVASEGERKKWVQWAQVSKLQHHELQQAYFRQRLRYCTGETIKTPVDIIQQISGAAEGTGWIHRLIEAARHDSETLDVTRRLFKACRLDIYPQLDGNGDPVWTPALDQMPGAVALPGSLLSGGGSENTIHEVQLFATTPEKCRFTYKPLIDVRFKRLPELIRKSGSDEDQKHLLTKLDEFYRIAVSDRAEFRNEELRERFFAFIQTLQKLFGRGKAEQASGSSLLKEFRATCQRLTPPVRLIPKSYHLSDRWVWTEEPDVDVTYRYHDQIERKHVIEVLEFGLQVGDGPSTPASLVVSAGKSPDGYEEVLRLLPHVEKRLGVKLGTLIRELPRRETEGDMPEQLYTELFELLWPWPMPSIADVKQNNADEKIQTVRKWYCDTVAARHAFIVRMPRNGANLQNREWELGRHYIEANQGHTYERGDVIDVVARPLLILFRDRELVEAVKQKAVIYVTEC